MSDAPKCPDCAVDMESGFIPELDSRAADTRIFQTCWHPGTPEDRKFLGIRTGSLEIDESALIKVVAYRCPQCGLVRQYAVE